jgi:hypothetical protein
MNLSRPQRSPPLGALKVQKRQLVGLEDSNSGRPRADEFMSGDITTSRFATATRIPGEDITTLKIYDGIDGIEPSSARVDTADMARNYKS